ncbi:hypothetical protein DBW29_12890 [Salmonella enterica subsp. enterica]|uniref:Uncharacterized protein n=1 Tax=Salmonella enterica subsp. enterica serovar Denver TaxID=1954177 RepID=A0A657FQR5_SALET|nr:hypothetical protein [Salmonella enterica]EBN1738002.1 hypothetical protein [Salmonella enterica subsp. enterica]ECA4080770.1 hypothetical protein [Salmonella enterica subsp. enterica serovar Texas]ECS7545026.1 hypothetical protein [Salmonella enterica subsp. enterica serovar Denver]EBL0898735.1 hypothetical protein [Salmonella enterica]
MTFQNNNQPYIKNTSKSKYQLNFYLFNKNPQIDLHQLTPTKALKINHYGNFIFLNTHIINVICLFSCEH